MAEEKRSFTPPPEQQRRLIESFLGAVAEGDVEGLRKVLAQDVVAVGDGGGKALAAKRPVHGFDAVAQMWIGIVSKFGAGIEASIEEVNGRPAVVARRDGEIESILNFVFDGDRILELLAVVNPEKLAFARRQSLAQHPPAR